MAEVVIGLGSSQSRQLNMLPEAWESWAGPSDKRNPELIGADGIVSGYEDLTAKTGVKRIAKEITYKCSSNAMRRISATSASIGATRSRSWVKERRTPQPPGSSLSSATLRRTALSLHRARWASISSST